VPKKGKNLRRLATDEDWGIARKLIDPNRFRLSLAFQAASKAGIRINASEASRILEVDEKTVRRWLTELEKGRQ
jgi:hypothetical protein